jgi:hypothetical protein
MALLRSAACSGLLIAVLVASGGVLEAQSAWEPLSKTTRDEMSIARGSLLRLSENVLSIWVQHRGSDGSLVAERHEVNCATQQRRVLEVWSARHSQESAPVALRDAAGWLPTEPRTPMRELVERACAIERPERGR